MTLNVRAWTHGEKRHPRNAWIYERPRPEMKAVTDRVGFWEDVKVG